MREASTEGTFRYPTGKPDFTRTFPNCRIEVLVLLFLSMKCPIPAWTSRSLLSSLGLLILLTFACSDSPPPTPTEPTYVDAEFRVQAEPERLRVSGATPGTSLALYDSEGMMVGEGVADEQGEFVFVGLETARARAQA